MNISPSRLKALAEMFSGLNDERQIKALSKLFELTVEQTTENNNKNKDKNVISTKTNERMEDIVNAYQIFESLNEQQQAETLIKMEEMKRGMLTKKDDITITINSKSVTLQQFIVDMFPNIDYREVIKEVKRQNNK